MNQMGFPPIRTSALDQFTNRLFSIAKNRGAFDSVLARVVNPVPDWSIDQTDSGQYFLKVKKGNATHSSEGLGEGLVSLIYIIDALYDSQDGDAIAIDEPELSLHPALQRKLSDLLVEYAGTRQIVLSTHSPYFVGLDALANGASVARVHLVEEHSRISQLSDRSGKAISAFLKNENNPHIFGLAAREIFFSDDRVILVEGQEDVIFFKRVEAEVGALRGVYFGWGIGGAENMERITTVLEDLGFEKVVGILDGNRAESVPKLSEKFPKYHFLAIPADDVRTKSALPAKAAIPGLLDESNRNIRPDLVDRIRDLFGKANDYLDR